MRPLPLPRPPPLEHYRWPGRASESTCEARHFRRHRRIGAWSDHRAFGIRRITADDQPLRSRDLVRVAARQFDAAGGAQHFAGPNRRDLERVDDLFDGRFPVFVDRDVRDELGVRAGAEGGGSHGGGLRPVDRRNRSQQGADETNKRRYRPSQQPMVVPLRKSRQSSALPEHNRYRNFPIPSPVPLECQALV